MSWEGARAEVGRCPSWIDWIERRALLVGRPKRPATSSKTWTSLRRKGWQQWPAKGSAEASKLRT